MSDNEKTHVSQRGRRRGEGKRGGNAGGNGNGGGRRSRGGRNRASVASYKRKVEERLFGKRGDQGRSRLEERVRASHGGPNFLRVYREYTKSFGMPDDTALLLMLLDLEDEREQVRVLEALRKTAAGAPLEQRSLLKSRLRNLEMSASSDALADAASELLTQL